MSTETPDLGQLFHELDRYIVGKLWTGAPAKIVSYDPLKGYATVQPQVSIRIRTVEGNTFTFLEPPQVEEVPVMFPVWNGAGSGMVGQPVNGDPCFLVMSSASLDEWKLSAPFPIQALDNRRMQLTDAVALLGGFPGTPAQMPSSGAGITTLLGTVHLGATTANDAVVTENRLAQVLNQWSTQMVTAFQGHTHVSSAPGSPSAPPVAVWPSYPGGVIGSTDVKAT